MKKFLNNPFVKFCARYTWTASFAIFFSLFLPSVFGNTLYVFIITMLLCVFSLGVSIIAFIVISSRSKAEQKKQMDERTQFIYATASKWSAMLTNFLCVTIAFVCFIFEYDVVGIIVLAIALFSQITLEIIKDFLERKY